METKEMSKYLLDNIENVVQNNGKTFKLTKENIGHMYYHPGLFKVRLKNLMKISIEDAINLAKCIVSDNNEYFFEFSKGSEKILNKNYPFIYIKCIPNTRDKENGKLNRLIKISIEEFRHFHKTWIRGISLFNCDDDWNEITYVQLLDFQIIDILNCLKKMDYAIPYNGITPQDLVRNEVLEIIK